MADNRSGSHRTGSSPSSRYNSGNSQRPASYSERYNRPNPYSGYLPPGSARPEQIYHPESVDPVRIKQLEREQEQARLHAYEDKAHMPHSGNDARPQSSNVQRQQRTQTTRTQSSSRSAQDAARRGKQTRRAQLASMQAARATASYKPASHTSDNPYLDEIRQNALDEAERLRTQPIEIPTVLPEVSEPAPEPQPEPVQETAPEVPEDTAAAMAAALPVAGAAQFAALSSKIPSAETESKSETAAAAVIITEESDFSKDTTAESVPAAVLISSVTELITPDAPEVITEGAAESEPAAETAEEAAESAAAPEENTVIEEEAPSAEAAPEEESEAAEAEDTPPETAEEADEVLTEDESAEESAEVITEAEAEPESSTEDAAENAEPEIDEPSEEPADEEEAPDEDVVIIAEEDAAEPFEEETPSEDGESEDAAEPEEEEEEDDVKVYVSPAKNVEADETSDDFDEDYYEYEDEYEEYDEYSEEEDDDDEVIVTELPTPVSIPAAPRRRNFETRISSELADPSAYSPGVAQDETLFIRKTRPEEATAVFSASTPGLAPDDDDFFEQWLEEGDDMIIKDKRQRRRVSAIIGGATMVFAIIGFIFVVVWFINGIPTASNSGGSQTDYASFILPVVNADPEPFETISSVDNNVLVEAAINRLTYGEAAADQSYTALEVENETRLLIPSADVEKSGKVLFGEEFTIDFANMYSIEDEKIYYYSAADDCFHVITTSGDIEPSIVKISHIGSRTQVLLEVGYVSATEENMKDSDYYKMMEYVLNAVDGGYYISAIRAIEEE